MKKSSLLFVTICLSLITASAAVSESRPIKLGIIASLSGAAEKNGKDWFQGAELAIEELRGSGEGVDVIVEDDGSTPAKVASAFSKLVTVDKVDGIIGGTWDFLAATAAPLANQYKIPFVTPTNPVETLQPAVKDGAWVFTNGLSLSSAKRAAARFLESKKPKSLALIYVDVPFGSMNANGIKEIARERGISVLLDIPISYESMNESLKTAALKVKRANPELVFVVLNYANVDLLFQEFERARVNPTKLITHTLLEAYLFSATPSRYSNAFGVFQKLTDRGFQERFERRFSTSPIGYAPNGYDAAMFMVRALQKGAFAKDAEPFSFVGITGVHRIKRPDIELVQTEAGVYGVQNGSLKLVIE